VNLGGLNGLFERQPRQHARQALGQHGLARPRWPDHQHVVRTGRGHFQSALRHGLSADVAEVRRHRSFLRQRRCAIRLGGREVLRPREQRHYFRQVAHAIHAHAFHHRGLGRIFRRHNQVGDAHIARADRYRQRPAHRANRAVERQFPDQHVLVQALHRAHRAQDPQRHRQVEAGPFLAHVGRRQVDGELFVRIPEARIDQRALDPLAALAHGGVGHADHHGIARVARRKHVDFDIDQVSIDAIDGSAARFKQRH